MGKTPLKVAIDENKGNVVAYLRRVGALEDVNVVSERLKALYATRIEGKSDIFKAAEDGVLELVQDHIAADPTSVHKRNKSYGSLLIHVFENAGVVWNFF
jgi:hypothetical protein